ncbi:MAG: TraR/DksA C4-type zinc finger protein [Deltaproteobacteria bacterium]|nr:TraR/DksA C4-type zinc finger protein [Deltaproteobacteria bacterium]
MDKTLLEELARALQKQRKVCLHEFKEAETGLRLIAEDRESELEESAQSHRTARFLSRRDDRTIREVEEIDAALERIEAGNYGKCQGCAQSIPIARLRFLPATRYCVECAGKREKGAPATRAEISHTVELPGDLGLLSDGELETQIHENVKADGRVDTEELRIVCRQGVVYLYGAVPSEKEHQILVEILTDVLGLKEVVDRIGLDEILWQREERSKREETAKTLPWEEPVGTEDIVETAEEGKEFSPPDRPIPEEE